MSKASRARAKAKRKATKAARKQAKRALYKSYADQGKSKRSKRFKKKSKAKTIISKIKHPFNPCGNPGCQRCYDIWFDPFIRNSKPYRMPHWMWKKWKEKT